MFSFEIFISLSLWVPLSYYFYNRIKYSCFNSSLLFLFSELLIITCGCMNLNILLIGTKHYYQKKDNEISIGLKSILELPSILIIVPTLNEDISLLKNTFDALLEIEYPREKMTIVIGDDGNRIELKQYIEEHYSQFYYHTRKKIIGHAKAGNLNDIIFYKENETFKYSGEFILILDSDMIPTKFIFELLIPKFYYLNQIHEPIINNNCAFVQSPQCFYNIDQYDFIGQHYQFFYYIVLKAYLGFSLGVPCCGTNVIFQRSILNQIKGFQYGSITEDFNTSLLLHSLRYESKYILHKTACGMAPLSLMDFYHQRKRWCIGGLQILFKNFQYIKKLPFIYQWIYGYGSVFSLFSIFYLLLFVGPIIDLLNPNIVYCSIPSKEYIYSLIPYTIIYIYYLLYLHQNLSFKVFITSIQESIFMIPYTFSYIIIYLLGKISFTITPKQIKENKLFYKDIKNGIILLPFLIYYVISLYAMLFHLENFKTKYINYFWICILLFQFFPPIAYFFQHLCQYS